jgi:hypothetical protein
MILFISVYFHELQQRLVRFFAYVAHYDTNILYDINDKGHLLISQV